MIAKKPMLSIAALGAAAFAGGIATSEIVSSPPPTTGIARVDERASDERDDSGAFRRALASLPIGGRLELACGRTYELASRIDVCSPIAISGCDAGREDFARTKIRVTTRTTSIAIAFRFSPWCKLTGLGQGATGASLRGVQIVEAGTPATPFSRVGVLVEAPSVLLERVDVSGFGHGVLVSAGIKRGVGRNRYCSSDAECLAGQTCDRKLCRSGLATSANSTVLSDVRTRLSDHAGVLVRGPDANAGKFFVSVVNGCQRARAIHDAETASPGTLGWPTAREVIEDAGGSRTIEVSALEACANVIDASFLGNAWDAPHVAGCGRERWPGYRVTNANARSVFVAAYAEQDCGLSVAATNALVLGGKSHWDTAGGLVISGRSIHRPVLTAPTIRSTRVPAEGGLSPVFRIELDGTPEWWTFEHDSRQTSAHSGWTRLLWKASSSGEVSAMRGGDRR